MLPRNQIENIVSRGLANAAGSGTTWFVTNGYSTGVARFIGDVLKAHECNAPVLGINQWKLLDRAPWTKYGAHRLSNYEMFRFTLQP